MHFMRKRYARGSGHSAPRDRPAGRRCCAIDEDALPVHDVVRGVAEILGIDPLYIANEGELVAIVAAEHADRALALMRSRREGQEAAAIGEVRAEPEGMVFIRTGFRGTRVVDMLIGDPLPRIC